MEKASAVESIAIAVPPECPGCGVAWAADDRCPKCGLTRAEIAAVLRSGCSAYERAREAAMRGRFDEAAAHLTDLARLGVPELTSHPAVHRLSDLCAAAAVRDTLPLEAWEAYDAARRAAADNDWNAALSSAMDAYQAAPDSLAVGKLYALCLWGTGREAAAERLRRELLRAYPDDDDLPRWRFEPSDAGGRVRVVRRSTSPPKRRPAVTRPNEAPVEPSAETDRIPVPPPTQRREIGWVPALALAGCLMGFAGLAVAVVSVGRRGTETAPMTAPTGTPVAVASPAATPSARPMPAPSPSPSMGVVNSSSNPPLKHGILEPQLQREWDEARRTTEEQVARRWFNAAIAAHRAGDYRSAERWAAAAAATGGKSIYLYEDALLLRARAAENLNRPESVSYYAQLAEECPDSSYAPVALLKAAEVARKQGRMEDCKRFIRRLQERYPRSPETARAIAVAGETSHVRP